MFIFDIDDIALGGAAVPVLVMIASVIINIAFSAGVYADSKNRNVVLAPGLIWSLATLFGGVFVAIAYWVVHCSALSSKD